MSVDYKNLRVHPFTGQKNPKQFTDVGQGNVGGTYFTVEHHDDMNADGFFLPEGIYYNPSDPTNLVIKDFLSGVPMAEVARTTNPSGNEYRADYDAPDPYRNTGFVECNASDLGKHLKVTYKGTGLLNNTINYPYIISGRDIPGDFSILGKSILAYINDVKKAFSYTFNFKATLPSSSWSDLCFGDRFVGVAYTGGGDHVILSKTGGEWFSNAPVGTANWESVCYGAGVYVAVASSGTNRVMTSPDGITWTLRSASSASTWKKVCFGNGQFVAVGTNVCMTSPDGITWTARTIGTGQWTGVCFGGNLYSAISGDSTGKIATSPDGITWTPSTNPTANPIFNVAYADFIPLYVATTTAGVLTSPDGITWTFRSCPLASPKFIACGNGSVMILDPNAPDSTTHLSILATSPDGITWTPRQTTQDGSGISFAKTALAYGSGAFVMLVGTSSNRMVFSTGMAE